MTDQTPAEACGPVSRSVLATVLTLRSRGDGIPVERQPLAEVALELARRLDDGVDDRALAGVAKELRATLGELVDACSGGEDDLDRFLRGLADV